MTQEENIPKTFLWQEKQSISPKLSKYTLLAHLYFFFNALLLPKGLLYTNILSPYFFYRQLVNHRNTYWKPFFGVLVFFDCIHLFSGVDTASFLISNAYYISCYFFVISCYHFFNGYENLSLLFKQVLLLNVVFVIIAIPFFFMAPQYQDWFWWVNRSAPGAHEFPRLKLFTYEASYYSLLFVPVAYYFSFKLLFRQVEKNRWLILALVLTPVLFSMSFGVIGATILTAFTMAFVFRNKLLHYRRPFIISVGLAVTLIASFVFLCYFFPDSPIVLRLFSILEGNDTSANGRTIDSFSLGWLVAKTRNPLFGVGLGQVKIQIAEIVRTQFNYWGVFNRYDIPNTIGETLAIFGIAGVILRLALQWYLFFKTKVHQNYYRLALFIFVFIYQFTGSFITNIVEYVIWVLAFSEVFEQFNVKQKTT